ncbi:MAG: hypothetical protein ACJARY_002543, partial [Candidatus Azotimanducaceae bacterium]
AFEQYCLLFGAVGGARFFGNFRYFLKT